VLNKPEDYIQVVSIARAAGFYLHGHRISSTSKHTLALSYTVGR
jgi:hypothetical protein